MLDPDLARLRLKVHLAEYQSLKSEQIHRMGLRDNLLYATLVTTAAAVDFALDPKGNPVALLVLPFAYFLLGWLRTNNDAKSRFIGHYLRHGLSRRIKKLVGEERLACPLGWEDEVRQVPERCRRKVTELASAFVTFVIPGLVALAAYWWLLSPRFSALPCLTSIVGCGLLVVLGYWLWKDRDFTEGSPEADGG